VVLEESLITYKVLPLVWAESEIKSINEKIDMALDKAVAKNS